MQIYIIRHAEAVPLGEDGITRDEMRPLTEKGRSQCRVVAQAFSARGIAPAVLLTSPLLRAVQTAEGLRENWACTAPPMEITDFLAPGARRGQLAVQLDELGHESVGVIGHQPDLGAWIGWLCGNRRVAIDLAKAGVALVETKGPPGKACGELVWMLTPEWLVPPQLSS